MLMQYKEVDISLLVISSRSKYIFLLYSEKEGQYMLNELTSKLLFVPFNRDYTVPLKIRELLTEDEFFEHCFVNTDFEEEIKRVNKADRISIDDSGDKLFVWEKAVSEEIQRLKDHQDAEKNFWRWIKDDGNGIYCIRGDAGTGKTTYLHHLKYHNKDIPISWEILDIQNAHRKMYWEDVCKTMQRLQEGIENRQKMVEKKICRESIFQKLCKGIGVNRKTI